MQLADECAVYSWQQFSAIELKSLLVWRGSIHPLSPLPTAALCIMLAGEWENALEFLLEQIEEWCRVN
jgi:hypothetical protein